MDAQYRHRCPPTPAEVMEKLESSMAEIDQMMAELRSSIRHTPAKGYTQSSNVRQAPELSPGEELPGETNQGMHGGMQSGIRDFAGVQSGYLSPGREMGSETAPQSALFGGGRFENPRMIPDRFDGSTPALDYLSHFEACCQVNRWSQEEAVQYLAASLRGSAVKLLTQQPGRRLTYGELVDRMKRRYGPGGKADVFLAELHQRRRGRRKVYKNLGRTFEISQRWHILALTKMVRTD